MTKKATGYANKTYAAESHVWNGAKARKYREPVGMAQAKEIAQALGVEISIKRSPAKNGSGHYYAAHAKQEPHITLGSKAGTWVVLHELAHAVAWPLGDRGHGLLFRGVYVDLVRRFLGDYWADRLLKSFESFGLDSAKITS